MSDKLDATISISADTSGVEAGIDKTKKSLKTLGTSAQQTADQMGKSGKGAGAGFEAIGIGVAKSAKDVERATRSMQQQLQRQIAELQSGGKATREYTEALARMRGVDVNALRPLLGQLDELKRKQQEAAGASTDFVSSLGGMKQALAAVGAVSVAAKFVQVADAVVTLNNQLKLATGSTQAAASAYSALFDIAQRSRVGFVELGETYASIARAAAPLGVSQERLLKVTESIGNAMTISGGSAQGLQAALVQLGQGLSSGVLRGEELNSVMEQAPRLAKALADGLGVTTGQLRAMGAEGEITAEKVIRALESQSAVLKGEVAGSALTVGQAFTQLGNSTTYAIGELDQTIGVSSAVAGAISSIASSLDGLGRVVADNEVAIKATLGFAGAVVGAKAATVAIGGVTAALAAARVATVGFTAALAANPIGAALVTVTALGAAAYSAAAAMRDAEGSVKGVGSAADAAAKEMTRLQDAAAAAGDKLAEAEKRLADLERKGAKGSANLMLREAHADAQRLVDKLKEAKRERDSLLRLSEGFSNSLRDREAGNSRGNRTNYQKDLFDSQQFLAQRNDGLTKQFAADIEGLAKAYANGALSATEYARAVTEANKKRYESTEAGKAEAKAAKDAAKGNKEGESAIQSYIKSLEARTAAQRLEIAQGDKLTESQRARIQLEALLADSKSKASKSQIAHAQGLLAEAEANEAWLKNASDVEKALADMQKAREQSLRSVQDSVKKLVEEAEATAYAETHNISLAEAVERLALARAENAYQQAVERQEAPATLAALEAELQARKKIVELTAQKGVKEANDKAQEQLKRDWERTAQTIGDTLADYIMAGGKDAATYLKRLFATLVLQPVVQTVVGGIMGTGAAGASGVASGGVGGIAGIAQNVNSIYGALSGSLTYGLGSAAASIGAAIGSTAATSFGAGMAASGFTASAFSTGASMVGAGATSTGLGMMAGAALPWVAGGLAIASLLGGMDFGSRGANHVGGAYSSEGLNDKEIMASLGFGLSSNKAQDITKRSNDDLDKSVAGLASGLLGAYNQLASVLGGSKAQINAAFAINPKYDDEKSYGYFQLRDEIGNLLVDYDNRKLSKDHDAAWQQYANDMANAFVGQLRSADIAGWADDILTALGDEVTVEGFAAAAQQIAVVDAAFEALGQSMTMFADLSDNMETSLLRAFGSMDALGSAASTFYQGFYSEQERYEASLKQMRDVLASLEIGIDPAMGEQAKADFRAAVEGAFDAGNGELAAKLLGINQAFDQVASHAAKIAQAAAQAASNAVSNAWNSLGTASGWAAQYLGDSSGLQAQLGMVQSSYKGATTVQGREAALEQIIALEQSLWQAQERNRQAAAQAAQQQAEALQTQLSAVNALISASQSLGKYAESIFNGADSGLSDFERLDMLAAEYSSQLTLAKGGDTEAMGNLQGTTSAYLQLAQQLSGSQADYSVLSGQIAAELAATAAISGASAKTQADTLQAQIDAALAQAQYASQQFEVSAATKELIAKQLADSAKQFDSEMSLLQQQVQAGMNTNYLLEGMPVELTGVLNTTLVPVIGRISDAAMAAASMSAASAEAARQAAAAAAAAAASAAAAALANARKGIDGSHYSGLSYVPFDGYRAELHKGERVLTAAENRMFSMPAIQVQSQNSSKELEKKVERLEAQMARMADATERLLDITDRVTADGNANATEIMNVRELAKAIAEEMA